jgi:co-chaperonin GroES (HSP10)
MHLKPLHDRIIVERLDAESTQRIGTIVALQERSL